MPDRRAHRSAAPVDRELVALGAVVASADRSVLDGCRSWIHLAREVVSSRVPGAWCDDLSGSPAHSGFEE